MAQSQTLSNLPPKGTYDWLPEEFAVRKYIFDTWRKVCQSFGYQEYLTPLVEYADLYRAKSGEDVGGTELTVFEDRGGRQLAIRPEMTPSVTRMVSKIYAPSPKPLRLFSIANFYRNEKPQRGRNREFWQLNYDIFGSDNINADLEILQIALEIMLAFNPPIGAFTLYINNRKLIEAILPQSDSSIKTKVVRLLDKFDKLTEKDFNASLLDLDISPDQIDRLVKFTQSNSPTELATNLPDLASNSGYQESIKLLDLLATLGYRDWVKFKPNVIRGFDYYDGMVFEVFDNNLQNTRSMFGGGRYNGLANVFGVESFPAVGCAPGDETTKLFLESWKLIPQLKFLQTQVLVTIFSPELSYKSIELSTELRRTGAGVELYPDDQTKLEKQLQYAARKKIPYVAILGSEEVAKNLVTLKNMSSGNQSQIKYSDVLDSLNIDSSQSVINNN